MYPKAGWPDIIIFIPETGISYYIEVKTTDRESPTQKRFHMKANIKHKRSAVCRSFAEYETFRNFMEDQS